MKKHLPILSALVTAGSAATVACVADAGPVEFSGHTSQGGTTDTATASSLTSTCTIVSM